MKYFGISVVDGDLATQKFDALNDQHAIDKLIGSVLDTIREYGFAPDMVFHLLDENSNRIHTLNVKDYETQALGEGT